MAVSSAGFPLVAPVLLSTISLESLGGELSALAVPIPQDIIVTTANKAYYVPFRLSQPILVLQLFHFNGAGAFGGNIDVGIYNETGTLLVSSGSTVQAGANVPQFFNVTDTAIGRGRHYFAVAYSSTVGTNELHGYALSTVARCRVIGMAEQTSAFPLPATATFAQASETIIPIIGASLRTIG